jgi:hypothetical protein
LRSVIPALAGVHGPDQRENQSKLEKKGSSLENRAGSTWKTGRFCARPASRLVLFIFLSSSFALSSSPHLMLSTLLSIH